jgi:hypothetical protein
MRFVIGSRTGLRLRMDLIQILAPLVFFRLGQREPCVEGNGSGNPSVNNRADRSEREASPHIGGQQRAAQYRQPMRLPQSFHVPVMKGFVKTFPKGQERAVKAGIDESEQQDQFAERLLQKLQISDKSFSSPLLSPRDSTGRSMRSSMATKRFAIGVSFGKPTKRPGRSLPRPRPASTSGRLA